HGEDVAAELLRAIPRAVARDEDRVLVLRREHAAGIEPHAERGRVRAGLEDRCGELAARAAPAEFRIWEIALIAERRTGVLAELGDAVELVLGHVLGHP